MPNTLWPVIWPTSVDADALDPLKQMLAESLAVQTLRALTLQRVGNVVVTVSPCGAHPARARGHVYGTPFHPVLMESGAIGNCWCGHECFCNGDDRIRLDAPATSIVSVTVNGTAVPETAYRLEDNGWLVRTDGGRWPVCSGDHFLVTYVNGYPVDKVAQIVAGILALEFYGALNADKKCRLPSNVTNIVRQGVTMQIETGMFPGGFTGIKEVDAWIYQWNPHALKTKPMVYSPDLKRQRRVG